MNAIAEVLTGSGFESQAELAAWLAWLERDEFPEPPDNETAVSEPDDGGESEHSRTHDPSTADEMLVEVPAPALLTMANVKPQALRWLWRGRIPLGTITIIDGDPGLGKSLVTVDLVARVSRGGAMPDGTGSDLVEPADVLMVFCEDDPAATVRPRLDAAGADVRRVHQLQGTREPNKQGIRPFTLADVATIKDALARTGARLVTIDPFAAYIGGRDSRADEKMRELLTPLADIARVNRTAIVIVRHLRKATGPAVASGAGSMGISGAARSVLLVAADPSDATSRVLAVSKQNLSSANDSLRFQVESDEHELPDGDGVLHTVSVPRVAWKGKSDVGADELVAAARADTTEKSEQGNAETWILDALQAEPVTAKELEHSARKAGFSPRTFERARAKLAETHKIWKHRSGGAFGAWWWGMGAAPAEEWLADRAKWDAT